MEMRRSSRHRHSLLLLFGIGIGLALLSGAVLSLAAGDSGAPGDLSARPPQPPGHPSPAANAPQPNPLTLDVNYGDDWVELQYASGHSIVITVKDSTDTNALATISGTTGVVPWWGGNTGWSTNMGSWSPGTPDIQPGYYVHGVLDGGTPGAQTATVRIGTIGGNLNFATDTVAGAITAAWLSGSVNGECGVWVKDGPPPINFAANLSTGGAYSCNFGALTPPWDLHAGQTVGVSYHDPDGNRVINSFQAPYARANYGTDNVDGWFGPGVHVVVEVDDSSGFKCADDGTAGPNGWLNGINVGCDMVVGDTVKVRSSVLNTDLVITQIDPWLNPAADTVGAHLAAGANASGYADLYNQGSGNGPRVDFNANASGDFSADLSGTWDVQAGDNLEVYRYDANWNQIGNRITGLRLEVNYGDNNIWGETLPNEQVNVAIGSTTCQGEADSNGNFWIDTKACSPGQPDIEPGDVVTAHTTDYTAAVDPVGTIQGTVDLAADTVSGHITVPGYTDPLRARCEVWTENGPPGIEFMVNPAGSDYTCDFGAMGFDLKPDHQVVVRYFEPDGDSAMNSFYTARARANYTWDGVDGWFGIGAHVDVAVRSATDVPKCSASGTAGSQGWMDGIWVGCDMVPGDKVHVTSDKGFDVTLVPIPITAHLDPDNDTVTGQMSDGDFPADGYVEVDAPNKGGHWQLPIKTDKDGNYTADFSGIADLQAGFQGQVWYLLRDGNAVGAGIRTLQIMVNYAHDWVNGDTEPGATVDINVEGKGKVRVTAGEDGWFSSDMGAWDPSQPDIAPGDAVTVQAAGYEKWIDPVGTIEGALNLPQNSVAGTIDAPFTGKLQVDCNVWVNNADSPKTISQEVDADGGAYTCDFDDVGWRLRGGQDVAVSYNEPDGDRVINIFTVWGTFLPLVSR